MFTTAVDGHRLTASDVSKVFDAVGPKIPPELDGAVETLRSAAQRSVGKSDVEVASILQEKTVSTARDSLSAYVQRCAPPTN